MYQGEIRGDSLVLTLVSPHMDQGFPGTLRVTVTYTFSPDNELTIRMEARSDRDTLVNLTGHSYFDLSGGRDPMGQVLRIDSSSFCENDGNTLPTGQILPVAGGPFDFRQEKPVGRDIDVSHIQLDRCGGYDHNYVLGGLGKRMPCAWLSSPETGISMELSTDLPGLQLYSGNGTGGVGKGGKVYPPRAAVCLEPQFFPNAMAVEGFPKPVLPAGAVYDHLISYRFSRG